MWEGIIYKIPKEPKAPLPSNQPISFSLQGDRLTFCPAQSALYALFSAGHTEEAGGFGDK